MQKRDKEAGTLNHAAGQHGPALVLRPLVTRERLLKYADRDPEDAREFVRFIYESRRSETPARDLG